MYKVERKVCPVIDEFYTFDLMEIHVKNLDLEFQIQKIFLHCILLITKVKLIVLLKNGKKVPYSFNIADTCVLIATL